MSITTVSRLRSPLDRDWRSGQAPRAGVLIGLGSISAPCHSEIPSSPASLNTEGTSRRYHRRVTEEPLADALEEIATELDAELGPIVAAIQTGESVEEAWEHLLKEALDEA